MRTKRIDIGGADGHGMYVVIDGVRMKGVTRISVSHRPQEASRFFGEPAFASWEVDLTIGCDGMPSRGQSVRTRWQRFAASLSYAHRWVTGLEG